MEDEEIVVTKDAHGNILSQGDTVISTQRTWWLEKKNPERNQN